MEGVYSWKLLNLKNTWPSSLSNKSHKSDIIQLSCWGIALCTCVREQRPATGVMRKSVMSCQQAFYKHLYFPESETTEDVIEERSETGVIHLILQSGASIFERLLRPTFWKEWIRHSRGKLLCEKKSWTGDAKERSLELGMCVRKNVFRECGI